MKLHEISSIESYVFNTFNVYNINMVKNKNFLANLTQRQIDIILFFSKNKDLFVNLEILSQKHNLTVRTIQNDIKSFRNELINHGINLQSKPGKGIRFEVLNEEQASDFLLLIKKASYSNNKFSNQNSRIQFLISYLINKSDYTKSYELSDMLFISPSRISSDLKKLKNRIGKYDLKLVSKPSHGLKIVGEEINKRFCIIKENIFVDPSREYLDFETQDNHLLELNMIGNIVTNILNNNQFKISDIVLQNLIVHIHVAISRMKNSYTIKNLNAFNDKSNEHSYNMAKQIMKECCQLFNIEFSENEVVYLAINIYGKREFDDRNFISSETNKIIISALKKLKPLYNIDLTNELDLRISLGLHLTPLMVRVKNNIQFENLTILNIKQKYPLAFNVASDFSSFIFGDSTSLSEDEISYIAVHFISYIEKKMTKLGMKKILIICRQRLGDTILMKQKINRYFDNIAEIKIISENSIDPAYFEEYDTILTTEKDVSEKFEFIRLVNYFLNEKDLKKIDYALRGLNCLDDILLKFDESLFCFCNAKSKNEIILRLTNRAQKKYNLDNKLEKSVMLHEERYTSSYFGNGIAIPHPEEPITDESFICVAILKNVVYWDKVSPVKVVLLVSIEKDNPKAFQLWNILSELISSEKFINQAYLINNFLDFITLVKDIYSDLF